MDKYFMTFLESMGPAADRRYVPLSSIERYRGKLPDQLLSYWDEHGWCSYKEGLFWTVDPFEYEPALEAWIGDTPFMERDAYHVIARSAFGKLVLWGEKTGASLMILPFDATAFPSAGLEREISNGEADDAVKWYFAGSDPKYFDVEDDAGNPLFVPAVRKFGRLKYDEMYGFVPALALGGSATLKNLQKAKAIEHLVLLAQLAPLRVLHSPFAT